MSAAIDIERAFQERAAVGLTLGAATSGVVPADAGGAVRHYAGGDIYWHPNTGAFEVHGGILAAYLASGGPGQSSAGRRELGYPVTHEHDTRDGRFRVSEFEFGAIFWVTGAGAVVVSGEFWDRYRVRGGQGSDLGLPIHSLIAVADAEAVFFEFGCLVRRAGGTMQECLAWDLPRVGRPTLVKPAGALLGQLYHANVDATMLAPIPLLPSRLPNGSAPSVIEAVWAGRLALRPVGGGAEVPLQVSVAAGPGFGHRLDAAPTAPLADRCLYDLVFVAPRGGRVTLSPHSVYAKQAWTRFGFLHVTDTHVARRNDLLHRAAMAHSAATGRLFANFNDGLRETIAVANRLHARGELDMVLATGDLVDYVFEDADVRTGGGNFELLVDIVCGRSPSPSAVPVEPLRVPIFMVPGNHDYRPNSYLLKFDVNVGWGLPDPSINNHEPFNVNKHEADILQDSVLTGGTHRGTISQSEAARMVSVEIPHWFLRRIIGMPAYGGYTVAAGPHRIVMLDTGQDVGIVTSIPVAFDAQFLGWWTGENESQFLGGSPNQEGVTPTHCRLISQALIDAGATGVVLVGLHGPPLNPAGNEYGHYFRETEHPTAIASETEQFLLRRSLPPKPAPTWSRTGTGWFKRGDTSDYLDSGVSRGDITTFLEVVAGAGGRRPVDLVLCGHGHRRVDFRVAWDGAASELRFFTDFYFDQPPEYYPSRKVGFSDPVYIKVALGAPLNGRPTRTHDLATGLDEDELVVPPCADSLLSATNKQAWWLAHRPFIVQTAASGPLEASQRRDFSPPVTVSGATVPGAWSRRRGPTFRGFRIGTLDGPAVVDLRSVTLAEARAASYAPIAVPLPAFGGRRPLVSVPVPGT